MPDPAASDTLGAELLALAAIGADGDGVTRTAWSPQLMQASQWLVERCVDAGATAEIDPAGNVVARWAGRRDAPALLVGSHIDTVRQGGRYDGALGVLGGLDAARRLHAGGARLGRPLWLAAFNDEEGTRFATSMFGSRAFAGEPLEAELRSADAAGTTVAAAMAAAGSDPASLPGARGLHRVGSYLELHIEQGPVLEEAGAGIGVVTAIVGLLGLRVTLGGQANHAGTTPMDLRRDALAGAARAILSLREHALGHGLRLTVGEIEVAPGGSNVVPGACTFSVDVRTADPAALERAEAAVRDIVTACAAQEGLTAEATRVHRLEPVAMDPAMQAVLHRAAEAEGAQVLELVSGAGHDAMVLGRHVPAAMLFVPSRGGISHNPEEFTTPAHCELGARVLAAAIAVLAT
jgi:allantoate deiminase